MKKLFFINNLFSFTTKLSILVTISLAGVTSIALPALGAENIRFNYGILSFSLSIDALELYAKKGIINSELNFYTKSLDEQQKKQLRLMLSRQIKVNPTSLYRLTRSPMGLELFQSLGQVATTHYGRNGFYALRGSIINAAVAHQDRGITLIDVIRKFPGRNIQVNLSEIMDLRKELTALVKYRTAIEDLVVKQANKEASITVKNGFLPEKDLRVLGETLFVKKTIKIDSRTANRNSDSKSQKQFRVRLYLPQGLSRSVPVAVLSHGFGAEPESFDYLGEHLASYGIAAISVEHQGSNSDYRLNISDNTRKKAFSPQEFIDRPLDIRHVLNELERRNHSDPILNGSLNLQQVIAIGHSLGGYTALTLAGAEIDRNHLRQWCRQKKVNLNMSLLMQCLAENLTTPPKLADPRIKAAIAISPISSGIHGPESSSKISVPTAIVSGNKDIVAPVVQEQVYPFTWLSAKDKYFIMTIPGNHYSSNNTPGKKNDELTVTERFEGRGLASSQPYIKAFTVAFAKSYLENKSEYLSYLTSTYAKTISSSEMEVSVVNSIELSSLEAEYNDILSIILPIFSKQYKLLSF